MTDDDLGHHGPRGRDRTGPGAVPRRMTDAELDQLVVELSAAVSPHITGSKYTRLRVVAARRLLDALAAVRAENARLKQGLGQIALNEKYLRSTKIHPNGGFRGYGARVACRVLIPERHPDMVSDAEIVRALGDTE